MYEYLQFLVPPVLGGVIGYITNDLAIKMLFRPHKPKFLFGWQLPFTPGLIPKEKFRIAVSIAGAVSENLMNKEVLAKHLSSDEMIAKITDSIDGFFATQKENKESLREFLAHYLGDDEIDSAIKNLSDTASAQVSDKLGDTKLANEISEQVVEHIKEKGLGDLVPAMFAGPIMSLIGDGVKVYLAKNINEMLRDKGPAMVKDFIGVAITDFSAMPVQSLLNGKDAQIESFKRSLIFSYKKLIDEHLPQILGKIDISKIISERINEMDTIEMEKLILGLMKKELSHIVWIGAALGALIGCLNIFMNRML
ncbi:MAG: DUF445 family protein [Paludibacteraceae bacterium]|nr:DUF445 family protein [Paludibacteraceae bacterium]